MNLTLLQEQMSRLQQQLVSLQESSSQQIARLEEELKECKLENSLLRQKLDALVRRCFGKKSEELDRAQLELLLSGLERSEVPTPPPAKPASTSAGRRRNGSARVRTPENLEVVKQIIEPKEIQKDREQWKQIDQEVSRQLDYQPGKFFWLEIVRPKYVRKDQRQLPPVVAAAPERASGMAAPGLLAHLLVSKFSDHLPFYRQQFIFWERHGVFITRQQMVLWMRQGTGLLEGIVGCIKEEVRLSSYVQVDETPIKYLDPGKGQCSQGYLWTGLVPGRWVIYEWHPSRATRCLDELLGSEFKGKIQCDGYSAYPAFARNKPQIQLFGCWAHARRGIFEAKEQAPRQAGWILHQMSLLYQWEAQLRRQRAGPATREVMRASHHRMVVERIRRAMIRLQPRYLPKSKMGQAISYILNQWPALARIVDHGEVEWTNNLTENQIRPTAVGKRNWLFFGSEEAGQRNAVVYTLIANCRLHGIEPYEYLKDVLTRLPSTTNHTVSQLTPLKWKEARRKPARQAA
jgi:transposase